MTRRIHAFILGGLLCLASAPATFGADTPHALWVKAKCALCHGEDGSGNTPSGKAKNVRDLRSTEIQKMTDEELSKAVAGGHSNMPGFGGQLTKDQVSMLVGYIRDLAKKK